MGLRGARSLNNNKKKESHLKPDQVIGMQRGTIPEGWEQLKAGQAILPSIINEFKSQKDENEMW